MIFAMTVTSENIQVEATNETKFLKLFSEDFQKLENLNSLNVDGLRQSRSWVWLRLPLFNEFGLFDKHRADQTLYQAVPNQRAHRLLALSTLLVDQ